MEYKWNKGKQDSGTLQFLLDCHIVWLSEVKNAHQMSVLGFNVYHNKSNRGPCKGGVMMVVKGALTHYITRVDMGMEDIIWIEL